MMSDQTALVPTEHVQLGTITLAPEQVVETATRIATALKKVVDDRKLFTSIQGKQYVQVEGWSTLGAMLGVLPKELDTKRLDDGGYEAKVELIRTSDGIVIGGASAICGMDEPRWAKMPEYARRSMAVTRATGKAYRLGFAWIMRLAGYSATPAEEMDFVEGQVHEVPAVHEPAKNGTAKPRSTAVTDFWKAIRDAGKTQEDGKRILELCHQDFEMALKSLQEEAPF
jgi:hypothetical protein